jgi:hypothetical protein
MNATAVEHIVANPSAKTPAESQRYVYIAAIFAAIGGLLFRYDTELISGAGMLFLPSPLCFLAKHGHSDLVHTALVKIRYTQDVENEFQRIKTSSQKSALRGHISELLLPAAHPALMIGAGFTIFQQVTGINTILHHAPYIIRTAVSPRFKRSGHNVRWHRECDDTF